MIAWTTFPVAPTPSLEASVEQRKCHRRGGVAGGRAGEATDDAGADPEIQRFQAGGTLLRVSRSPSSALLPFPFWGRVPY